MNSVMNIGVSGIRAALSRFAVHSQYIVNHNTLGYAPRRPLTRLQRSRNSNLHNTDMINASQDHTSCAMIIRTAGHLQGSLLDIHI